MTILFSNASPKYQDKAFLVRDLGIFVSFRIFFQEFLFLHQNLQEDKFGDADLQYGNSIFKFLLKNMQIRHFWSKTYRFLFLHQTFQEDKTDGRDSKHGNSISEFQARNM